MRTIVSLAVICGLFGTAAAEPLWDAEVRSSYGVSIGNTGMSSAHLTPLTLTAMGSALVNEDPKLSAYGGFLVETLAKNAAGTLAGVKLQPNDSGFRLMGGGTWQFAPYTLWGATASAGKCSRGSRRSYSVCGDLVLTSYFAGSANMPNTAQTQVQFALGIVFDGGK